MNLDYDATKTLDEINNETADEQIASVSPQTLLKILSLIATPIAKRALNALAKRLMKKIILRLLRGAEDPKLTKNGLTALNQPVSRPKMKLLEQQAARELIEETEAKMLDSIYILTQSDRKTDPETDHTLSENSILTEDATIAKAPKTHKKAPGSAKRARNKECERMAKAATDHQNLLLIQAEIEKID